MEESFPVYDKPSKEEILSLYEDYEWHDLLDTASPDVFCNWNFYNKRLPGNWQRKEPDWRFASGMLFMGTDVLDLGCRGAYGEFTVKTDVSNVEASLFLWHGYSSGLSLGRGDKVHEYGVILDVSANSVSLKYFTRRPVPAGIDDDPVVRGDYMLGLVAERELFSYRPKNPKEVRFTLVVDRSAPPAGEKYPCHVYMDGEPLCEPFYALLENANLTIRGGVYKEIKFRGPEVPPQVWIKKRRSKP